MKSFPNYRTATLSDGSKIKVAPIRLGGEDNQKAFAAVGEYMEGNPGGLLKNIGPICAALKFSLMENHNAVDADEAIAKLLYSGDVDSPFMQCVFAMMGFDRKPDANASGDDE